MPWPTPQGTQALVSAMVGALRDAGDDAHLLVYERGASAGEPPWVHRLRGWPRVASERSGPSWGKLALDARMLRALRTEWKRLGRCPVVAHNVEAALVARAARVRPRLYVAHTRFDTELPSYATRWGAPLAAIGGALDHLATGSGPVGAVSPALAEHLGGTFLPPPWMVETPAGPPGRYVLYAGNLDGYQGWEHLVDACARADLPLLVATESDPEPLQRRAAGSGLRELGIARLAHEADRRAAHARSFVVAVPRRSPGGLPIKLLDALARDRPVVAMERALAGLEPDGVRTVPDDDPAALADALDAVRQAPPAGGRRWIASELRPERFVGALRALLAEVR